MICTNFNIFYSSSVWIQTNCWHEYHQTDKPLLLQRLQVKVRRAHEVILKAKVIVEHLQQKQNKLMSTDSYVHEEFMWKSFALCVFTFTYKGSLRQSIIRVVFSSHTGFRFLWMVLLLNTSLPASLNLT